MKEEIRTGSLRFDPTDPIYAEHFPDRPVVPGSLVVGAFLEIAEGMGFLGSEVAVENFRFREFVVPGLYDYRVEARGDTLRCFLSSGDKKLVTGSLKR
ncbi:MAG TPA: hypothetical protein PLM79_04420 [Syntrophobacteraceae bacterium]|nr:hypothetical protein [Syntrophobacteraceae bacterium]